MFFTKCHKITISDTCTEGVYIPIPIFVVELRCGFNLAHLLCRMDLYRVTKFAPPALIFYAEFKLVKWKNTEIYASLDCAFWIHSLDSVFWIHSCLYFKICLCPWNYCSCCFLSYFLVWPMHTLSQNHIKIENMLTGKYHQLLYRDRKLFCYLKNMINVISTWKNS